MWPFKKKTEESEARPRRELIQVADDVRVENGPRMVHAEATEQLLSNLKTHSDYRVGGRDALGRVIQVGKEIDYLDYRGKWVWYLYQEVDHPVDHLGRFVSEGGGDGTRKRYVRVGQFATRAEALAEAKKEAVWQR